MILAAIGGIHGNLPALEAALGEIEAAGIQTILNTGDSVAGFPWPNETVALLQSHGVVSVQGNFDRLAVRFGRKRAAMERRLDPAAAGVLAWTHEHCRGATLEYLRTLPKTQHIRLEGIGIFLCHGHAQSQSANLAADSPAGLFQRQREAVECGLFVCGAAPAPFARETMGTLFVNPGPLAPLSGELGAAQYALINTETAPWEASFHKAEYDAGKAEDALAAAGLSRFR